MEVTVDGGDGPACVLSENIEEVRRILSDHVINKENGAAIARRIDAIFFTTLRPDQLAANVRLPGADTEEGALLNVFLEGDEYYLEPDPLSFYLYITPGAQTLWFLDYGGIHISHDPTLSTFPLEEGVPKHWLKYENNQLRVYSVVAPVVPMEGHGGDDWTAAFVDLCA